MIYTQTLLFPNRNNLYACLLPDLGKLSNPRVICSIKLDGENVVIVVNAKDETAFKAILSSVNKLVLVHNKTMKLVEELS